MKFRCVLNEFVDCRFLENQSSSDLTEIAMKILSGIAICLCIVVLRLAFCGEVGAAFELGIQAYDT